LGYNDALFKGFTDVLLSYTFISKGLVRHFLWWWNHVNMQIFMSCGYSIKSV